MTYYWRPFYGSIFCIANSICPNVYSSMDYSGECDLCQYTIQDHLRDHYPEIDLNYENILRSCEINQKNFFDEEIGTLIISEKTKTEIKPSEVESHDEDVNLIVSIIIDEIVESVIDELDIYSISDTDEETSQSEIEWVVIEENHV
jgi:hypothetical protein